MSASIVIGTATDGSQVRVDIEELLASRLLVQGNSGSGKSHLLRRLLEESAPLVQQIVIDPEGDFVTLAKPFGHVVVNAEAYDGRPQLCAQRSAFPALQAATSARQRAMASSCSRSIRAFSAS